MDPNEEDLPQTGTAAAAPGDDESAAPASNGSPLLVLRPEDYPNYDLIVTEDGAPLDSIFAERQQRLLTEPLHSSWAGPGDNRPFVALANVGLFAAVLRPPLVPDCLLSLDVELAPDLRAKENRSYFIWVFGKVPEAAVEIVSDRRGGEQDLKMREYARMRIPYYVIFDPDNLLKGGVLRILELRGRKYHPVADNWLTEVGLGLTLWTGTYEGAQGCWLRWRDAAGQLIPTGKERADEQQRAQEQQRADQEQQRADQERRRADQEQQRADQERQRADDMAERLRRLEDQLRGLGTEPSH